MRRFHRAKKAGRSILQKLLGVNGILDLGMVVILKRILRNKLFLVFVFIKKILIIDCMYHFCDS